MKIYSYHEAISNLDSILKREGDPGEGVGAVVSEIIRNVRKNGDAALMDYTRKFDGAEIETLRVTPEEIEEARDAVGPELLAVYQNAADNIRSFHEHQLEETWTYQARPGVTLGQKITPIGRVGLYVPGGKAAYPSTVLMNAIPAKVAGVQSIAMVTPPGKNGKINPNILAAASIAGADEIYKCGGAQAIAALAYGTESIAPVDKITGPGNIFVATAKREVFGKVAIDMIAGPSEVLVIADQTANPAWIAADLLAQAEHDEMAMPILISLDAELPQLVIDEIERQLKQDISRSEIASKSVHDFGFIFTADNTDQAFELANAVAPEHLELVLENPEQYLDNVQNAGAVFIGEYTPEPAGDYFAGPNHTLPTSGTARFSSPLGVYDFMKRTSILRYDEAAIKNEGRQIAAFAKSEGLDAHARSVERRLED
ncbi:MAG: histidinol dehydrogenase [Eubacteriaceae bacterium]|jgi:histidinol dehydrogenase